MAANGRGAMRTQGRTPPFLVIGLVVALIILGFNYWRVSSRNSALNDEAEIAYERSTDLQEQVRMLATKKMIAEKKSETVLERVRELEGLLNNKNEELMRRDNELNNINRQLAEKGDVCQATAKNLEICHSDLQVCLDGKAQIASRVQTLEEENMRLKSEHSAMAAKVEQNTGCSASCYESAKRDVLLIIDATLGENGVMSLYKAGLDVGDLKQKYGLGSGYIQPQAPDANVQVGQQNADQQGQVQNQLAQGQNQQGQIQDQQGQFQQQQGQIQQQQGQIQNQQGQSLDQQGQAQDQQGQAQDQQGQAQDQQGQAQGQQGQVLDQQGQAQDQQGQSQDQQGQVQFQQPQAQFQQPQAQYQSQSQQDNAQLINQPDTQSLQEEQTQRQYPAEQNNQQGLSQWDQQMDANQQTGEDQLVDLEHQGLEDDNQEEYEDDEYAEEDEKEVDREPQDDYEDEDENEDEQYEEEDDEEEDTNLEFNPHAMNAPVEDVQHEGDSIDRMQQNMVQQEQHPVIPFPGQQG